MKIEVTKDWCVRMAQIEGDAEIGAGISSIDPVFDGETLLTFNTEELNNVVFGRFVRLMRRKRRMTLETLADSADVDIAELVEIEDDARHKPEVRTVYQLANYFNVPRAKLLQIAGLTTARDSKLLDEAVRFAARSDPIAELTIQERDALEAFVAVLSNK
ncbi:MAG: hypothetical protein ABS69_00190 [Nitrosomonadales bacterium SCN 54-20]|nr:MAG: hypothetical protein ABS69_00190 [Nitrosomonadales bacterium SCN 54-20]